MRKAALLLLVLMVAGLMSIAGAALADHPNSCATPDVGYTASSIHVCTAGGYTEASSDAGGYILLDGASSNPDPLDGYLVITAGGVGCSGEGDWNPGSPVSCTP
jgi:hypothetical protein